MAKVTITVLRAIARAAAGKPRFDNMCRGYAVTVFEGCCGRGSIAAVMAATRVFVRVEFRFLALHLVEAVAGKFAEA